MSEETKKRQERQYVSKNAGLSIALPDGLTYLDKTGGSVRERSMIKFPARGGKMFLTDDPAIQDFIEGSEKNKPCNAFRMEVVKRVPTAKEIEQRKVKQAQEEALANYKFIVEDTGVMIPFRDMTDKSARATAAKIGAETTGEDKKKLSKEEVVDNIEMLVYGEIVSKKPKPTEPEVGPPVDHAKK